VSDDRHVGVPASGDLGLPEHSALTIEGRIERAGMVGTHLTRRRDSRERAVWRSSWAGGLWLIAGAFAVLVGLMVALYLVG
jgi:hypothetical protein